MSLSTINNSLVIHNSNPTLDPATIAGSNSDWSLQFYYQGTTTGESDLFFIGNDSTKYLGVRSLTSTGELQLYFNNISGNNNGVTTLNTGIFTSSSFKPYTFVRQNNSLTIYQGNTQPLTLNTLGYKYTNSNIFADFSVVSNPQFMSIGGCPFRMCNVITNVSTSTNFINFWDVALSDTFINTYYRLTYETDGPNLLCNVRGDTDYTSKDLIVERDVDTSLISLIDVCSN